MDTRAQQKLDRSVIRGSAVEGHETSETRRVVEMKEYFVTKRILKLWNTLYGGVCGCEKCGRLFQEGDMVHLVKMHKQNSRVCTNCYRAIPKIEYPEIAEQSKRNFVYQNKRVLRFIDEHPGKTIKIKGSTRLLKRGVEYKLLFVLGKVYVLTQEGKTLLNEVSTNEMERSEGDIVKKESACMDSR